jgi:hypothetical protein
MTYIAGGRRAYALAVNSLKMRRRDTNCPSK